MRLINCFHGTTLQRARNILNEGFQKSSKKRMWLGTGIYFFENAPGHAKSWAEFAVQRVKNESFPEPAVILAQVDISAAIDMTDAYYPKILKRIIQQKPNLVDGLNQNGVEMLALTELSPQQEKLDSDHFIDHKLVDELVENVVSSRKNTSRPMPTAVRASFMEGNAVLPKSWLFDEATVMVNVLENDFIINPRII